MVGTNLIGNLINEIKLNIGNCKMILKSSMFVTLNLIM